MVFFKQGWSVIVIELGNMLVSILTALFKIQIIQSQYNFD